MTKLFYHLEDYFDALAQQRPGAMSWLIVGLRSVFGFAGDVFKFQAHSPDSALDGDIARHNSVRGLF